MAFFDRIGGAIRGVGNFLAGSASVIGGLLGEIFGRIIGIPGFIIDLFGFRATKHLRIKFVILADENGQLIPKENVDETFKLTKRIFREQANIEVHNAGTLLAGSAPTGALDISGAVGSFFDQWLQAGNYLSALAGFGTFTRRISVIVVRSIEGGDAGRSFGPLVNFVVIQKSIFSDPKVQSTLVAHEIGHACGLYIHRDQRINLMHHPSDRGEKLTWWQSNVVRGSRFVWYW